MHWSIEEQTIPLDPASRGHEAATGRPASVQLAVDPADTSLQHLRILNDDGSGEDLIFVKNGALVSSSVIEAPAAEGAAEGAAEEAEQSAV